MLMHVIAGSAALEATVEGAGAIPVLLLHGLGGTRDSWIDIPRKLARSRRVIVPDLRGCGASQRGTEPYSFDLLARDAVAVLDAVGAEICHVVGHSLGGVIAQELLTSHGARLASAVLISTSSRVGDKAASTWLKIAESVLARGLDASDAAAARGFSPEFAASRPDVVRELARIAGVAAPAVYAEQARIAASYDYTDALALVRLPVLILQGLADRLTGPGGAVILSRAIPRSTLHMVPDIGHNAPLEMSDRFVELLDEFFSSVESEG